MPTRPLYPSVQDWHPFGEKIFMPAGVSLDLLVYPQYAWEFFQLRLLCSACLLFIWWFVKTPLGSRHYRLLGWLLPAFPTFFISLMIFQTEGAISPYYAGLNLVLLGENSGYPALLPTLLGLGIGMGLLTTAVVTAAVSGLPAGRAGVAGGITNAARQAGGALGVAVLGAVSGSGLPAVGVIAAALWLVAIGVTVCAPRDNPVARAG